MLIWQVAVMKCSKINPKKQAGAFWCQLDLNSSMDGAGMTVRNTVTIFDYMHIFSFPF